MPSPRNTKKRAAEPAAKQQAPQAKKQATESKSTTTAATTATETATNGSNGTMAEETPQRFETLQLHAGYVDYFSCCTAGALPVVREL